MNANAHAEVAKVLEKALEAAYPGDDFMVIAVYVTKSDNQVRMISNTDEINSAAMLASGMQAIEEASNKIAFKTPMDN